MAVPALIGVGVLVAPALGGECVPDWFPGNGVPGIAGTVNAVTSWDPDGPGGQPAGIVVGGSFTLADNVLVKNIAFWNGTSWSALGDGLGTVGTSNSSVVNALTVYNGTLVAGGTFTISGATALGRIAQWNGTSWVRFNSGTVIDFGAGDVNALTVANGELVAGGSFTAVGTNTTGSTTVNRLARWNGTVWSAINPTGAVKGVNSTVFALATATNGDLVAGGSFATAGNATTGSTTVNNVARWAYNGTDWVVSALATGTGGDSKTVRTLAIDSSNGNIIIGGDFSSPGHRVARWTGSAWQALGDGIGSGEDFPPSVYAVAVLGTGEVVAGGSFFSSGMPPTYTGHLAKWNGSSWTGMWTQSTVRTVQTLHVTSGGTLVAGGTFKDANGVPANGVASFNGTTWSALASSAPNTSGPVTALHTLPNGDVIASGGFRTINGVAAERVARYSNGTWSGIGSGLATAGEPFPFVFGQQQVPPASISSTTSGDILVGGMELAITPGGDKTPLTRWDGSEWTSLGLQAQPLLLAPSLGLVSSITVMPSGDIVAGGLFFFPEDPFPHFLARWDGEEWHDMGITSGAVLVMKVLANGHLIIGGAFADAGGITGTAYIAEWDGTSTLGDGSPAWTPLATGMGADVYALAVLPSGNLVAAGYLGTVSSWDGSAWTTLGTGFNNPVYALTVMPNGDLVAGGAFTAITPSTPANRIARWNGLVWTAIGGGIESGGNINNINFPAGSVFALAVAGDGSLLVGGDFGIADGSASAYIARYGCEAVVCAADFNGVNGVTVQDIFDFLTAWLAGSPTANFNGVNGVTVQDIFDFLTAWLAGC